MESDANEEFMEIKSNTTKKTEMKLVDPRLMIEA